MYDFAVFIGRFQPFHSGHRACIEQALIKAKQVILVIGSHDGARTTRNPFTTEERERIIWESLADSQRERVLFACVNDYTYNHDKWIGAVQGAVFSTAHRKFRPGPTKIALAGMAKDHTSFYLNMFPGWDSIAVDPQTMDGKVFFDANHTRQPVFSSTYIRDNVFHDLSEYGWPQPGIPEMRTNAEDMLLQIVEKEAADAFMQLAYEWKFEREYKEKWGKGPHNTVDSIVVQAGHILLIQRGKEYGHGKWALPGGFINLHERINDAGPRELQEETKLKVPLPVLNGSIVKREVYDEPYRDLRSRNISHATYYRLRDIGDLPKVKGSDDAEDARWFSISEFQTMRSKMFADHFCLINNMLGL